MFSHGIHHSLSHHPSGVSAELLSYAQRRGNNYKSYHTDINMMKMMEDAQAEVARATTDDLKSRCDGPNATAEDCLQLGLRYSTGYQTRKDYKRAIDLFSRAAYPERADHVPNTRRLLTARALSLLADVFYERGTEDTDCWNADDIFRAAACADACVALGLVTSVVLMVAAQAKRSGALDPRGMYAATGVQRFQQLPHIWRAMEKREAEIAEEDRRRGVKVARKPLAYRCANAACGIEATKKATLMRCSGPCAADVKPSYCSKECQREDWKYHKKTCKAGSKVSELAVNDVAADLADLRLHSPGTQQTAGEGLRTDGNEISMEWPAPGLPGGKLKVSSSTMTPALMREIRDELDNTAAGQ